MLMHCDVLHFSLHSGVSRATLACPTTTHSAVRPVSATAIRQSVILPQDTTPGSSSRTLKMVRLIYDCMLYKCCVHTDITDTDATYIKR